MQQLLSLLEESKHCVVFTGAGVSTLSGIRDFRGAGGFYSEDYKGMAVEDILSLHYFHKNPAIFYRWAREFLYNLEDFEPSIVHTVLALMEQRGIVKGVYTQNIDLLHQKGGSQKIYEIHGSPERHFCLSCHHAMGYAEVVPFVKRGEVPHCPLCQGVMKPDIVFYGEGLKSALLDQAYKEMEESDLVLVLGSSLTVQPAASLPMVSFSNGGKIVIVNKQATPLDSYATLRYWDLLELFSNLEDYFSRQ